MTTDPREWNRLAVTATIARAEIDHTPRYTLVSPGTSCPEHAGRADRGCPACNVSGAENAAQLVVTGGAQ